MKKWGKKVKNVKKQLKIKKIWKKSVKKVKFPKSVDVFRTLNHFRKKSTNFGILIMSERIITNKSRHTSVGVGAIPV